MIAMLAASRQAEVLAEARPIRQAAFFNNHPLFRILRATFSNLRRAVMIASPYPRVTHTLAETPDDRLQLWRKRSYFA